MEWLDDESFQTIVDAGGSHFAGGHNNTMILLLEC